MNRRDFVKAGLIGASTPAALLAGGEKDSNNTRKSTLADRPNVLFIMTDQQFAGAMSNAGNPDLHTPAMDFIARNGVSFDRAYCSDPICVPSRTSWITAKYPHQTGVTYNTDEPGVNEPTVTRLFKDNGYDTGYVGKWHITHDYTDREWHGFDFMASMRNNKVDFDIPEPCCTFLKKKRDNPFFLMASFVNPHDICEWARINSGIKDQLKNGQIPEVPNLENCPNLPGNLDIPENEPSVIRQQQGKAKRTYPTVDWENDKWRQYRWAYYRMIELVDAHIQTILDTLIATGQLENTMIVFTSDHGDGMGAHRWNQKTLFYDEVSRIPFIFSNPSLSRSGARDAHNLTNMNLDVFPTLFDYCGITPPENLPGISLKPLIEGKSGATGHEFVVSENDLQAAYGKSDGIFGRMIRTRRYKYVCYSEGENPEQLFDMELDPGETTSLVQSADNSHILDEHRQLLRDHISQSGDFFSSPPLVD